MPIGYRHFEELRTKTTRALLRQPESHASPWLTANVLSSRLQDLEEYVHLAIWRNLKRHLYGMPISDHCSFFAELADHSGEYKKIFGPAGVAKRSALRLGWCVQASGHIITHENVKLHLVQIPWRRLCLYLHRAWMSLVSENIRHRKECSNLTPVLRQHTAKALAAIERATRELQYSSQATSECPLCRQDAPFRHSLFECDQLQDARIALNRDQIDREDADNIWRIPVATQQPDELLLLFASEHLIEGSILPDMIELLHSVPHAPFVFIDGSGYRQRSTSTRLSGWAIVLSTAAPDQHASLIREYKRTRVIPSCF